MKLAELESLFEPISPEAPCGSAVDDDVDLYNQYLELESAGKPKPISMVGDDEGGEAEPDWREVKRRAIELLKQTKDLRVAVYLVQALARTDGFPGVETGLGLIRSLVSEKWDEVHPRLDPSDDNDPFERVNALEELKKPMGFAGYIELVPILKSRALGTISHRDVYGQKDQEWNSEESEARLKGVLSDVSVDELEAIRRCLRNSVDAVEGIDVAVKTHVGSAKSTDLGPLVKVLTRAFEIVNRVPDLAGEPSPTEGGDQVLEMQTKAPDSVVALKGELRTRADVLQALDAVRDYFVRNEPSSPIPVLLERATRLASMSFLDIIKDMAPEGVSQVEQIAGVKIAEE